MWGCQQAPSTVVERDGNLDQRLLSKIEFQGNVDFERAVIVDVRPRFQFEVSKLPRSFHALVEDWDLRNYSGIELDKKRQELQRLLSLKGVDPLTQVVILGYGLKGKGEEFLMASTFVSLGVNRLHFLNIEKAKESLGARELEAVANAPKWSKSLTQLFNCQQQKNAQSLAPVKGLENSHVDGVQESNHSQADLVIGNKPGQYKPSDFFDKNVAFVKTNMPKRRGLQVSSPQTYWAYGIALYLADQGQQPCVL